MAFPFFFQCEGKGEFRDANKRSEVLEWFKDKQVRGET